MKIRKIFSFLLFLNFMHTSLLAMAPIDRRGLIVYSGEGLVPRLQTMVGKKVVASLLSANGDAKSTTSCRLENKRMVLAQDLEKIMVELKDSGFELDDRERKKYPEGTRAGTFTFYGTALKFKESNNLPVTSIKLRIRMYLLSSNGQIKRSKGYENNAFLEIKIKNPYPEYPLSVHKYRLMLPDEDILALIKSDPKKQEDFFKLIQKLKNQAHVRDIKNKESKLIEAIFEQIKILAVAEPTFIKPTIGITYFRNSKKYDQIYLTKIRRKKEQKTRSFELTIDDSLKAFRPDMSSDQDNISLDKYFKNNGQNQYLIKAYAENILVVEFKQPDAVGYAAPGVIKHPRNMNDEQRVLWQAFVGDLKEKAVKNSVPDKGKFSHIKKIIRELDENQLF